MKAHSSHQDNTDELHIPVLLEQTLSYLRPQSGESYLDLTAGYGGHARCVLEATQAAGKAVLVDRDSNAIYELKQVFGNDKPGNEAADIRHTDFYQASRALVSEGRQFDLILADLGVSSPHLDQAERGFAIAADGPLDMRMDQSQLLTAAEVVNDYTVEKLAGILRRYGEEPKAFSIARKIVEARKKERIETTAQLAEIVARAWAGKRSKVHPATRTFQALRIAVNDELQLLEHSLPLWIDLLAPQGRLVVISFHSLEDRLVKLALQAAGGEDYDATITVLTKRPETAEDSELVFNPRARSAKLRAAVKK